MVRARDYYRKRKRIIRGFGWRKIVSVFLDFGFAQDEAEGAANQEIKLKDPKIQDVLERRSLIVKFFMEIEEVSRPRAIEMAAARLEEKHVRLGATRFNIYLGLS